MPKTKILASGKRFQISFQIINARRAGMFFNSSGFMKQSDSVRFRFLLALTGGRVFTWSNNQSAGKL
jgi:hypothetical protein